MISRANKPDTQADIDLRACVGATPPKSFIVKAGAGSGKTTSLIKALSSVINIHGEHLKKSRQRVACITYTEIAAAEIWKDVGNDSLVHVSTIHSFMWLLAKPFQNDIRAWVSTRIAGKIADLEEKRANYGPRVQQRTKDKDFRDIERFNRQAERIATVRGFRYGTGSDYLKGILGHDDILKLVPFLIAERPLFRTLLSRQFPFVFVDESQDTTTEIVEALKLVEREPGVTICLGFFGDPMQRIYATGSGLVTPESNWREIPKPENFRCSKEVLKVANSIRRNADDLIQVSGQRIGPNGIIPPPEGAAHLFILPADNTRDENLLRVRNWMAGTCNDEKWRPGEDDNERVKFLVIVHQMAARRLGFGDLYLALNSGAPQSFKDGFLDGTSWPLAPCINFLVPVAIAGADGRELDVMHLLRRSSPLLEKDSLIGVPVSSRLKDLRDLVNQIVAGVFGSSRATVGDLLKLIHQSGLLILDQRLVSYLEGGAAPLTSNADDEPDEERDAADESEKEIAAIDAFFACPAIQLIAYHSYILQQSPFGTQQGVKGAEFERVIVVLDDAESRHFQFSYEKYFGLKALSDNDLKHIDAGEETVVDRTRRLFYVSCTRALKDLAVVLFTEDPITAKEHILTLGMFEASAVHTQDVLSGF